MNQWTAGIVIVALFMIHERVTDWLTIRKQKIAERTAENESKRAEAEAERERLEKLRAETEQITAELRKQTAEKIEKMPPEQAAAFGRVTQEQVSYGSPCNLATMQSYIKQQLYSTFSSTFSSVD